MTVASTFVPRPTTARGPADSSDQNAMIAAMLVDLINLVTQANTNEVAIKNTSKILFQELMSSRAHAEHWREYIRAQNLIQAMTGSTIHELVSLHSFMGPQHFINFDGLVTARQARVEPIYGQAMLPANQMVPKMYSVDPETDLTVVPDALNYETVIGAPGGEVTPGTVRNAFNGNNRDYWVEKITYPLEDDAADVVASLIVTLPDHLIERSNLLTLHPYPLGQMDIEEIEYSTTAADPSILLPGFSVVHSAGFRRWHFEDLPITRLRIRLRQRNFIEENGRKVFYIGAQEIGLYLAEFDKVMGETQPLDNNGFVTTINAPEGYRFENLVRLFSEPAYSTGLADTGITVRIYSDAAMTNLLWNSFVDPRLQDTNVGVGHLAISRLYMLVTLNYIADQNLSPVLERFVLGYTTG